MKKELFEAALSEPDLEKSLLLLVMAHETPQGKKLARNMLVAILKAEPGDQDPETQI